MQEFLQVLNTISFVNFSWGNVVMILAGIVFIYGHREGFEPLLLVPIGFGIVVGNIPGLLEQGLGVVSEGSVLNYLYFGVNKGIYPSLIFLGIGAMTDFSTLIANPKLILLGAAAQVGIFGTFLGALLLGFNVLEAASIGIIGGADGPTSIFLASKLAPNLIGPIALAAYSYMALVPVIQPPIMKLLTTPKERLIRMKPPRQVSKKEKIFFPVITFLVTAIIAPGGAILLAMLFLGNLLKECGVTERLALTARTSLIDIVTVLVGFTVGAKTTADVFLTPQSLGIFFLGAFAFRSPLPAVFYSPNHESVHQRPNQSLISAGVSACPQCAFQVMGQQSHRLYLLMMPWPRMPGWSVPPLLVCCWNFGKLKPTAEIFLYRNAVRLSCPHR